MKETLGMLNLKIARLEQRLKVLELQQAMSRPYPTYQANLVEEYARYRLHLEQLLRRRVQQPSSEQRE